MSRVPDDDRYVSLMAQDQYFRALRWMERLSCEDEAEYLRYLAWGKRERAKAFPDARVLQRAQDAAELACRWLSISTRFRGSASHSLISSHGTARYRA